MNSPVPDVTPKDLALRAIGRNLVSLQRLERILKGLAGFRPIACRLPELAKEIARRRRRTEVSTLGKAIDEWLETAQGQNPKAPSEKTELDVLVSISPQLRIPQHVLDEHAKELEQIRIERNWLVHTGLTEIDFNSEEVCRKLIAHLDEQERRVIKQIEFLRLIVNHVNDLNQALACDDVQQDIRTELLKERPGNDSVKENIG